jgi:hypothetical protein
VSQRGMTSAAPLPFRADRAEDVDGGGPLIFWSARA